MKLTIELVPESAWRQNARTALKQSTWRRLSRANSARVGHICEICGRSNGKTLDCHEIWEWDDARRIQRLIGLISLCKACHQVKHIGWAMLNNRGDQAKKHFSTVNGLDADSTNEEIRKAFALFEARSRHDWLCDLSWLFSNAGAIIAAEDRKGHLASPAEKAR